MQLLMVCSMGMLMSVLSISWLYQAYSAYQTAIFCEKKEQLIKLSESALSWGICCYQAPDKKIIAQLHSKKRAVVTHRVPLPLSASSGEPLVVITIMYKLTGTMISMDAVAQWGKLRERITRTYVCTQIPQTPVSAKK